MGLKRLEKERYREIAVDIKKYNKLRGKLSGGLFYF